MEQSPDNHKPQKERLHSEGEFLKNLRDTLNRVFEKVGKTGKVESKMALYEFVSNFALGLEQKYPDARSRRLWHLLVMSTPPPGANINIEDYPGEDSIVQFIEKLNPENF